MKNCIKCLFGVLLVFVLFSCKKEEDSYFKQFDLTGFRGEAGTQWVDEENEKNKYLFEFPGSIYVEVFPGLGNLMEDLELGDVSRWYTSDIPLIGTDIAQKQQGSFTLKGVEENQKEICLAGYVNWTGRWRYVFGNLVDIGKADGIKQYTICYNKTNKTIGFRGQLLSQN